MDFRVEIHLLLAVLVNYILTEVESISYGPPRRLQNTTDSTVITAEARTNIAVHQSPERNETSNLQSSSRRNRGPFTILYPLTFPQSRRGKYLNLTLPSEPPTSDVVEPRIVNHQDLYSYFSPSPQRYNKSSKSNNPVEARDVPSEPEPIPTNAPIEMTEQRPPQYDTTRLRDFRNYRPIPPNTYHKGSASFPAKPGKQVINSALTSPESPPKTYFVYQPQPDQPPPQTYYKNRVQYHQLPPKLNATTDQSNAQPLRNLPENVPSVPPARYNKAYSTGFVAYPFQHNIPLNISHLNPRWYNKPKYEQPPLPAPEVETPPEEVAIYNLGSDVVSELSPPRYPESISDLPEPPRKYKVKTWNTCYCIPYYLCKDGVINSGGRSIASHRRQGRALDYNFRNRTAALLEATPKIMNTNPSEIPPDAIICEENKVCCQISFSDDTYDNIDEIHYPVATPPPDPQPTAPPRHPDRRDEIETCGVRRALGVQSRLNQVQYPADVAEFGEYPWQIAVLKKIEGDKSLYLCGGVLISNQWVATAAHCIKKERSSPLVIRLGEWDVNRKDEVYPYLEEDVDTLIVHPEFNQENLQNDLALLRMKAPLDPRVPHVNPACLPKHGQTFDDNKCWVSGWGKDFFGPQGEYQNVLKEVDVPVVSRSVCTNEMRGTNLGTQFTLHPGFLCAGGEPGKDACTGDGGSPLVCKSEGYWYVVGLVSWGIGCGQPGVPGVYVNLLYYTDWINSIIYGLDS
ncbi:protein masquerade-like [Uloborus diversus]|uniref:protein masquerade-like n=1 Tax=Uloborus diversus TaxID=327109 RepID=UPI002409AE4D|nr:protein masquerade-like [Uloborus diversus]